MAALQSSAGSVTAGACRCDRGTRNVCFMQRFRVFVRTAWACLFLSGSLAWLPAPVQAQGIVTETALDAEARGLFEAGRSAFTVGRFEEALSYFQKAYELSKRPELLYNTAAAAERLRRDDLALESYRGFVAAVPADAANVGLAQERIRFLEQRKAIAETQLPEAEGSEAVAAQDTEPSRDDTQARPVWKKWWFWTAIGVVVAGSAVAVGVAASDGKAAERSEGSLGGTVYTLGAR